MKPVFRMTGPLENSLHTRKKAFKNGEFRKKTMITKQENYLLTFNAPPRHSHNVSHPQGQVTNFCSTKYRGPAYVPMIMYQTHESDIVGLQIIISMTEFWQTQN